MINHNKNQFKEKFKPNRLIFLADSKGTESENIETPKERSQDSLLEELRSKKSEINEGTYKKALKIAEDPNLMSSSKRPYYKQWIEALVDGKFAHRGKYAHEFLKAAAGGSTEKQKQARELIKDLSGDALLSAPTQDIILHQIYPKMEIERFGLDETEQATQDTKTSIQEQIDISPKTGIELDMGEISEEVKREVSEGRKELTSLSKKSSKIHRELVVLEKPFEKKINALKKQITAEKNKKVVSATKVKELQSKMEKIQKDMELAVKEKQAELDESMKQFNNKMESLKEVEKAFQSHFSRVYARLQVVDQLAKEAGFNVFSKQFRKLKALMLKSLKSGNSQNAAIDLKSLSIEGGASGDYAWGTVTISSVTFEPTDDTEPQSPGKFYIQYKDSDGKTYKLNILDFLNQVLIARQGYTEIKEKQEFDQEVAVEELSFISLSKGDKFSREIKFDESANRLATPRIEEVVVVNIDETKGTVTLDKPVEMVKKGEIKRVTPVSFGGPKAAQTLTFGQFAKFLKKYSWYRSDVKADDLQQIIQKKADHTIDICEANAEGMTEKEKNFFRSGNMGVPNREDIVFEIPEKGGEATEVLAIDSNSRYRRAKITRTDDNKFKVDYGKVESHPYAPETPNSIDLTGENDIFDISDYVNGDSQARYEASNYTETLTPSQLARKVVKEKVTALPKKLRKGGPGGGGGEQPPSISNQPSNDNIIPLAANAVKQQSDKLAPASPKSALASEMDLTQNQAESILGDQGPFGGSQQEQEDEHKRTEQPDTTQLDRQKYGLEEALPYSDVFKAGNMTIESRSWLKKVWMESVFLDVDDIWEMGKAMWEYHMRRFERRQKGRYSSIGQELPIFAPEMKRINQAAEHEDVDQFKQGLDDFGIPQIQERLQKTGNVDEMKAAFTVLSERGQLRWDDIDMWKNLNRFLPQKYIVPIPRNGDPRTQMSEDDERTGQDFLLYAIDYIWGKGTYNDWYNKNKSTYQSTAQSYYEEGKELEGVTGGHMRRLSLLLRKHKEGEFVDPHEYEGLILHMIFAGKSLMESKLYYIIEGAAAENPQGRTILSFDRVAHINSEMLTQFPLLEYICAGVPRKDGKSYRFTIEDYRKWIRMWDGNPSDPSNNKPNQNVYDFLWRYILPSDQVQNRVNKVFRSGENLDHDDMFAYMPPATEGLITQGAKSVGGGGKSFFTVEGYANAFPGFSQYFRSLAENDLFRTRLVEAFKSYVRFEGIMTDKFEREQRNTYTRLDDYTLEHSTIVSDESPKEFIDQMNAMVRNLAQIYHQKYGDADTQALIDTIELVQTKTGDIFSDQNEMKRQQKINNAFKTFGTKLNKVVAKDKGGLMVEIVKGANLWGMPSYQNPWELEGRKQAKADTYTGSTTDLAA